jgi:isoleucyl-tRNA synthetase
VGEVVDLSDLHRPNIDDVIITKDGKQYKRVEEVLDCWFESGSMPIAQQHYPFENQDKFNNSFPADYVGEGLDQTRLWFYVQHVIATILFNKPAYKNVLVNGMIMAADGQKLSKRLKNYPDIYEVFNSEGADSLRLYLLSNYQAMGADYARLDTLNNSLRFFKMYADIDKWPYPTALIEPQPSNVLDKWVIARLNQVIGTATKEADAYKLAYAINPIFELIDDLSNWYIRRSRRRFWKSEDDADKLNAYATLHYCLMRISQLLAPWAPFIAEELWQELSGKAENAVSVHLSDWPSANSYDEKTLTDMQVAREYINEGLNQRAAAGIKVRQPLQEVRISHQGELDPALIDTIKDELNVKEVIIGNSGNNVVLNTTMSESLKLEGLMRDIVRQVQETRKKSGFNVDDRIALLLTSNDPELQKAIKAHQDTINSETLAIKEDVDDSAKEYTVNIEGKGLTIKLQKAS